MTDMCVSLWYPRVDGNAERILISLDDVRAADDLRVGYDFERDGWVVERPKGDQEWTEVAFTPAFIDELPE